MNTVALGEGRKNIPYFKSVGYLLKYMIAREEWSGRLDAYQSTRLNQGKVISRHRILLCAVQIRQLDSGRNSAEDTHQVDKVETGKQRRRQLDVLDHR